jgi:hypothetical protein
MSQIPSCVTNQAEFEKEEDEMRATHALTAEQVNWRRWAIVNKCGNDLDSFRQEYPSSAEEAFLTSGRPVFSRERVTFYIRRLRADDARRKAARDKPRGLRGELVRVGGRPKFRPDPDGPLTIYERPKRNADYVIGGDACRGISNQENADFASWQVFDRVTWHQCAVYHNRCQATEFALQGYLLGFLFNKALLAPESNDHGNTVIVKLEEWRYPRIFFREVFEEAGRKPTRKRGWETNVKTRPLIVDAVDSAIRSNMVIWNDLATLKEFLTFVRNRKTGKAEADKGCHDDTVIAAGIALAVMEHGPRMQAESVKIDVRTASEKMVKKYIASAVAAKRSAVQDGDKDLFGGGA